MRLQPLQCVLKGASVSIVQGSSKSSEPAMNANCHLKLLIGGGSALNHFLAIVFFLDYIFFNVL